jgi:hypothetical protein
MGRFGTKKHGFSARVIQKITKNHFPERYTFSESITGERLADHIANENKRPIWFNNVFLKMNLSYF